MWRRAAQEQLLRVQSEATERIESCTSLLREKEAALNAAQEEVRLAFCRRLLCPFALCLDESMKE
jgi:hypothetical protein